MTLYLIVLVAFLTHIGFAGSRLAVPPAEVAEQLKVTAAVSVVMLAASQPFVSITLPGDSSIDQVI